MSISIAARKRASVPKITNSEGELRGVVVGFGAVGMVAAGLIAAIIPVAYPLVRFGVIAVAVFLFAAAARDVRALAVVIGIGFLIYNGFLEDRFGQLAWHRTDVWLLVVLIAAGVIGSIHRRQSALTDKEKHDA